MKKSAKLRQHLIHFRAAFEILKSESKLAGKNLVNISAVAEKCGVSRKYLYGKIESPDESALKDLRALGEEIKNWKLDASKNPEKVSTVNKSRFDKLKEERDSLAQQNFKLIAEKDRIRKNFNQVVEQRDKSSRLASELEARIFDLQATNNTRQTVTSSKANVMSVIYPAVVISPDRELMIDGRYQYDDEYLREIAWANSLDQLKKELSKPIPATVIILIGIQGAGKSSWAEQYSNNRRTIIFDAMNLSRADRHKIIHIVKASNIKELTLCAACFPVCLSVAKSRNANREADRIVPEKSIDEAENKVEFPTVEGPLSKEGFDQIIIVRT